MSRKRSLSLTHTKEAIRSWYRSLPWWDRANNWCRWKVATLRLDWRCLVQRLREAHAWLATDFEYGLWNTERDGWVTWQGKVYTTHSRETAFRFGELHGLRTGRVEVRRVPDTFETRPVPLLGI